MKMTLLEMTQNILDSMLSDDVNSISDTEESKQVARIVQTTYFEMISNRHWPHLKKLFQLEGLIDLGRPTHMRLPIGVAQMEILKYNKQKVDAKDPDRDYFQDVKYLQPEDFLKISNARDSLQPNIKKVPVDTNYVLIRNDKQPEYWTTFDDEVIIFDSYDVAIDDTMHAVKTQCHGYMEAQWTHDNNFTPDLPAEAFSSLLAEAKSTSFVLIRQENNAKVEQIARRQGKWLSRKSWRAAGGVRYPNYGRPRSNNTARKNPLLEK
jgi:hypothetical protein